jgi:hypothetical protein
MTDQPRFIVERIGRDREPIVVIDHFAADPAALRQTAMGAMFVAADHHYPGIRAPLPESYLPDQRAIMASALGAVFAHRDALSVIDASYSIVTTPPDRLSVRQRLPHCDAFTADRIALVHYLAPAGTDGTAFFRHRSTGFETIDEQRAPIFFDQLDAEIRHHGPPPPTYINGDTALFDTVKRVEARYNRAILYRSRLLHSGAIAADATLSSDPESGRLTITAFLSVG